jgi:hypothetical protein
MKKHVVCLTAVAAVALMLAPTSADAKKRTKPRAGAQVAGFVQTSAGASRLLQSYERRPSNRVGGNDVVAQFFFHQTLKSGGGN